jgi:hypothetical protein
MCAQKSSLHIYCTENGYRITNITIYNIYYQIISYKRLNRTLSEALQRKDTITPYVINWWQSLAYNTILKYFNSSSASEQQVAKVEYTYGWYSASVGK